MNWHLDGMVFALIIGLGFGFLAGKITNNDAFKWNNKYNAIKKEALEQGFATIDDGSFRWRRK